MSPEQDRPFGGPLTQLHLHFRSRQKLFGDIYTMRHFILVRMLFAGGHPVVYRAAAVVTSDPDVRDGLVRAIIGLCADDPWWWGRMRGWLSHGMQWCWQTMRALPIALG
jgi:hypothetical protein